MAELTCGLVQQAIPGETVSGDAHLIIDRGEFLLVAVVDGLGHGHLAHEASQLLLAVVTDHPELRPKPLLELCHARLATTRGAVATIVRLERGRGLALWAGVGNVATHLVAADRVHRPVPIDGTLGHEVRKVRSAEFPFTPGDLLIMHTDGISDRLTLPADARSGDLQQLAYQLAARHGRHHDDQLLLILKEEPG